MTGVPTPEPDRIDPWVDTHLAGLWFDRSLGDAGGEPVVERRETMPARRGGQTAADATLAALDLAGYASRRSIVDPPVRRGATVLSPYIRHGLISLGEAVAAAGPDTPASGSASAKDRSRFVDEVWWQEYCRHLYARAGEALAEPLRREPAQSPRRWPEPMPADMVCLNEVATELETTGWLVNQTRMWVASQWTVRAGHDWAEGEDWFFAHLLDGSRAANRFGWQWTTGAISSKAYGFSRWQVRKRAPRWCERCPLQDRCPIDGWPDATPGSKTEGGAELLRSGPANAGPADVERYEGPSGGEPEAVWITAESMGDNDPALVAHPELPAVFVFDRPLLARLRLSRKRLVFLAETLADLAQRRTVEVHVGSPIELLAGRPLAATHAPVPGFRRRRARLNVVAEHPWPWLTRPDEGSVTSYSSWRRRHDRRKR